VCNEVCGTFNGLLGNGTDQAPIDITGDRDARVTYELGHHRNVSTRGEHQSGCTVPEAWKVSVDSGWPCVRII
jgi:hypothetical protein